MKRTLMLIVALALLLSASAATAGMYAGLYGGATWTDAKLEEFNFDVTFKDFDVGGTGGGKIGYWSPNLPWLAVEVNAWTTSTSASEFPAYKTSFFPFTRTEGTARFNLTLANFSASALAQYPAGRLRPYVGAGLLVSYADWDVSFNGVKQYSDDDLAVGAVGQLGLEYNITPRLGVFSEYRFTYANYMLPMGEDDLFTHALLAGLAFHF